MAVYCRVKGCRSVWYRPRHEPVTLVANGQAEASSCGAGSAGPTVDLGMVAQPPSLADSGPGSEPLHKQAPRLAEASR